MMRRLILILGSMVLAAIAFLIYMLWQSPAGSGGIAVDAHLTPSTLQSSDGGVAGVGTGQSVWIKQYDKDGALTSIMSAKRYVPREGGNVVDVIEPQAEFFLTGGRRMILTGDRGVVNVEQRPSAKKGGMGGGGEAAPTSGFLYNVVVRVFEPQAPDHPALTLNTNNISFDNQTLKFATEKFTDSYGQPVNADMVPVIIRGDDIDFDGRGMKARYDDLNKRIATLEITHGDQMVIKRTDLLPKNVDGKKESKDEKGVAAAAPSKGEAATPSPGTPGEGGGEGSAATARTAPVAMKTTSAMSTKPASTNPSAGGPTIYRATFLDEVRVTQADAPLVDADAIAIEFFPLQGKSSTTKPTTRQKPTTGLAASAASKPSTTQAASTHPTITASTTQATTAPTTQQAPVIVRWKGTLRLVAIDQPSAPLAGGESIVTATGTPLQMHQPQGMVRCGTAVLHSRDNAVQLKTGPSAPVVMFDSADNNMHLRTQKMHYTDAGKSAELIGASELHMIQPKQGNTPAVETTATWKDRCNIAMFDTPGNAVKQIDLAGNVVVNNPRLKTKSSSLSLAFKPDTNDNEKSTLELITATGNVECDLSDPDHLNRTLSGEKVVVATTMEPSGNLFPTKITAMGSAQATEEDQSINADQLEVTLKPAAAVAGTMATSRPALESEGSELQTFHASGSVVMLGNDGRALADTISVDRTSGHPLIELRGNPASLTQQGRTITGPIIFARPDDGYANVDGAGTLHAIEVGQSKPAPTTRPGVVASATTKPTTRPVDLAWAGGADLDAAKNFITFRDRIVINTVEPDGTIRHATGDLLTLTLKNAPTTQPAKNASTTRVVAKATTQPANPFKDKVVSSATLSGNVNVTTELDTPAGDLLKRTLMRTDKLTANLDDAQQLTSVDIPGPGQALIEDRSPQKLKEKNSGGATAIEWKKSFRLDQAAPSTATLTGDVWVHHDPATGPGDDSVDLKSSRVIVTFAPESKTPTTKPLSIGATAPAGPSTKPSNLGAGIRQIYAAAPVQFKTHDVDVSAQTLQYTPDSHTVFVSGNDRQPVEVINLKAQTRGQFQQAWYDTEQGMITRSTGVSVQGGK